MKLELKYKAIKLRKEGKTYSEIQKTIGIIPKGTLSSWLKPIELTKLQKNDIARRTASRAQLGREKAGWTNHRKRLERIEKINFLAIKTFEDLTRNPLFLPGLVLYLAEGSRKREYFQFMNSDPNLVKLMVKWIDKIGKIPSTDLRARLYTHHQYANEGFEKFWSRTTGIPDNQFHRTIYKATSHVMKKNPNYKGCLRIEVSGSELYWKTLAWAELMHKRFRL
jgi:hypothetical protein